MPNGESGRHRGALQTEITRLRKSRKAVLDDRNKLAVEWRLRGEALEKCREELVGAHEDIGWGAEAIEEDELLLEIAGLIGAKTPGD